MAYYTTHEICTNYHGNEYKVSYWAEGDGSEVTGYVTDFDQYFSEVTRQMKKRNVDFAFIGEDGKLKHITDTKDLQDAVENLDHEGVLAVKALDKTSKGKAKRQGKKGKAKKKWYYDDTDEESEVDDWQKIEPVKGVQKNHKSVLACIDRFVEQSGTCYYCPKTKWTGRKYTYTRGWGYYTCGSCYDDMSKSDKGDWEATELPWDDKVPKAPLGEDYYVRPEVSHLQYLLTRLGHMKLSDTTDLHGSYRSKTEDAVADFRKVHKITGGDKTQYDAKCQKKLAQVVKKLSDEGHIFLS